MKYYLRVGDTIFSVSKKEYKEYYKALERWKYILKQEKRRTISLEKALEDGLPIDILSITKTDSLEDMVMGGLETKALMLAVERLESQEKEIIMLIYFCGCSQREVAEKMKISKTAVVNKRDRALWRLKKYLRF